MDATRDHHTKSEKNTAWSHLYVEYSTNEPTYKTETGSHTLDSGCQGEEEKGKGRPESFWLADANYYV